MPHWSTTIRPTGRTSLPPICTHRPFTCATSARGSAAAGRTVAEPAAAIDLLPTLTSLAGVPRLGDRPLDGRDLSPLLLGTAEGWPDRRIFSTWAGRVSVRTPRHRLDHEGRLYDMVADPGQTTPVNAQHPEIAAAVAAWRAEMFGDAAAPPVRGGVDPRPFPVGYAESPRTWLPTRDGEPRGGVRRSSGAPNCSYFVDWTSTEGCLVWEIDVNQAGDYAVELLYTCPPEDAGSTIELSFRDDRLTGTVEPGWDPPAYTNQDTLPRPPAESPMKEFRPQGLGTMRLERGRGTPTLRALKIPGKHVMDLRALTLTRLP